MKPSRLPKLQKQEPMFAKDPLVSAVVGVSCAIAFFAALYATVFWN
jgi:hypothetical protein